MLTWSTCLELELKQAKEEAWVRDSFSSLWVAGSFMKQAKGNDELALFCPHE